MPIQDPSLYPDNWKEISRRIRFTRANGLCEQRHNGERCEAPHKCWVQRSKVNPWIWRSSTENAPATAGWHKAIRIILTVSHLDHDPGNCQEANLMAMCQRCHLLYDLELHKRNAAETRRLKSIADGQQDLF